MKCVTKMQYLGPALAVTCILLAAGCGGGSSKSSGSTSTASGSGSGKLVALVSDSRA